MEHFRLAIAGGIAGACSKVVGRCGRLLISSSAVVASGSMAGITNPSSSSSSSNSGSSSGLLSGLLGAAPLNLGGWLNTEGGSKEFVVRILLVVAAAAAGELCRVLLQDLGQHLWDYLTEVTTTTATIDSDDEAYRWLLLWLADHPSFKTSHSYQITSSMHRYGRPVSGEEEEENGTSMWFTPGAGAHLFRYHHKFVLLRRTNSGSRYSSQGIRGTDRVTITMMGKSSARKHINTLVEEARLTSLDKDKSRTIVYVGDQYGNWARSTARNIRPMSSVILEEGVADRLVHDAKGFLGSSKWYSDRGIPYRRGYLLHGKPGCGKTSFITALAGELHMNIYVINLASKALNDEVLAELMRGVPYRGIVLFEDIDAAFVPNTVGTSDGSESESEEEGARGVNAPRENLGNGVTFSGLLNVLDGVASAEGRLVFFTTNHFGRLSKTLIRPGRVDLIVKVGLATVIQARRMFNRFYEERDDVDVLAEQFASVFIPDTVAMAQLQAYLMNYKDDPHAALRDAPALLFPTKA